MDIQSLYNKYKDNYSVSTDTRKISKGDIFFALKGDNFNGNKFAKDALEKGACLAVIDEKEYQSSSQYILVDDVLLALQQFANFHRKELGIPIIGITGSNGKTTTKELAKIVLSKKYKTFATPGNFNNHIGVPLSLLAITPDIEVAILELGENHLGELTTLCEIAEPDCGLITNIGKDHIEGYGNFEGNVRAKSELYHYLIREDKTVFINAKDSILSNMAKRFKSPLFYASSEGFSHLDLLGANPFIQYINSEGQSFQTQLIGRYNFENIQTAYCIGKYFKVNESLIHEAISAYVPQNNRSQLVKTNSNTILLDAYNANPSSVEVALESFELLECSFPKMVILGDMFELGNISEEEHRNMIQFATSKGFEKVAFCGNLYYAHKNSTADFYENKEDLVQALNENHIEGYYVLLKGSRGMALETLIESLS